MLLILSDQVVNSKMITYLYGLKLILYNTKSSLNKFRNDKRIDLAS
jgi:hypothetical protein